MVLIVFVTVAISVLGLSQQITCTRDVHVNNFQPKSILDAYALLSQLPEFNTNVIINYKCQCVPPHLCQAASETTDTFKGSRNIRKDGYQCEKSGEICCSRIKQPTSTTPPALTSPSASTTPSASSSPSTPPVIVGSRMPINEICGYRNPGGVDANVKANGNEAEFGEFPWVVAILNSMTHEYGGAGVLIHPEVVMTAAHIASKFKNITVRAGEWDSQTTRERLNPQDRLVDKVYLHPDFESATNDIALIHLKQPVQLDSHIDIICLPEQNEGYGSAERCYANGWGEDGINYSEILKKVRLDTVPFNFCYKLLKNISPLSPLFKLHERFICVGGKGGNDTYQGYGPLACPVGDGRYKLSGLVVGGIECGKENVPAVYVRVSEYRNWVDDIMSSWGLPTDK